MRNVGLSLALSVSLFALEMHAACGVERWSIKTGTDAGAPAINLSTWISTTIYNLHSSAKPASLPASTRLSPRETNQYSVGGTLTKYVREGDSDYHLVIQDGSGRTMIVELPSINCVGAGSPFGTRISTARAQFDARFTATSTMKTTSTPVTVRGIGFWDFLHGQTGVAPNGIEIHPVLNISIGSSALAPGILSDDIDSSDALPGVRYPADMVLDNDGGRVHVYRGGDGVGEVLFHGGPVLERPSLQVLFVGDSWNEQNERAFLAAARGISSDGRFAELARYGVDTAGLRINTRRIAMSHRNAVDGSAIDSANLRTPNAELTDLDIQRALADAIEAGQIQHVDPDAVYLVVLDPSADAAVGTTRDWLSYHSQFHPTDLAMRYVVVRGGLDPAARGDAVFASVARALVNPGGDGWF
jgi:hypothetical protein